MQESEQPSEENSAPRAIEARIQKLERQIYEYGLKLKSQGDSLADGETGLRSVNKRLSDTERSLTVGKAVAGLFGLTGSWGLYLILSANSALGGIEEKAQGIITKGKEDIAGTAQVAIRNVQPSIDLAVSNSIKSNLVSEMLHPGTVAFFAREECPKGWREFVPARGRYIVGLNQRDNLLQSVGTALSDKENRPAGAHTHPLSGSGAHTHTLTGNTRIWSKDPSATEKRWVDGHGDTGMVTVRISGDGSHTHTVGKSPGPDGTNAPYILLRTCEKL